jgi:preprotein translocase subunit SecF
MRIFSTPNIDFLKWRWAALAASGIVIVLGIGTIMARGGLPLGVDFSGGTVLVIKFEQPTGEDVVRRALPFGGDAVVQSYGEPAANEVLVRLPMMQEAEQGANLENQALQVEEALRAAGVGAFEVVNKELVGPVMGEELRR